MAKNSIVIIARNIKIDRNYQNCLTYTEQEMYDLCYQNRVNMSNNFSFVKESENSIRVPFSYQECLSSNYIAFQNPRYSNKWFFAFIDSVEYLSDGASLINFTVDIFSTWFSYWNPVSTFVIREHTNEDTIGANTIPEGLETGEYIHANSSVIYDVDSTYICVGVSEVVDEINLNPFNSQYNGIYSGIKYLLCETPLAASNLIRAYDKKGKGAAINTIFLVPQALVGSVTFSTITIEGITTQLAVVPYSTSAVLLSTSSDITPVTAIGNYIPVNNKLFTYPYCYFYLTNNVGQNVVYHYEDFINNTAKFKTYGAITPGCSIKTIPLNYKKLSESTSPNSVWSYNYGIMGAKLPMCSWVNDSYTNWLTQNGVNIAGMTLNKNEAAGVAGIGSMLLGAGLMATGIGGAMGMGLIAGGATGIFSSMQSSYQHDIVPEQARGSISGGDVQYSLGWDVIQLFRMTIREEFARSIDDYFTRFGYMTNRLKVPNQTGRRYFNYVEIGKSEIIGYAKTNTSVPAEAMEKINNIYRSGVTLWHDHSRIGNYTENTIITE